jgi:streptogramin lyase
MLPAVLALAIACPSPAAAASLHAGDLVALDSHWGTSYTRIVRVDPSAHSVELLAMHGLLANGANALTVLKDGRVLVASYAQGLFLVDPTDGTQTLLLTNDALGARPVGLALEPTGTVVVLAYANGEGRLMRLTPGDGSIAPITSGTDLVGSDVARAANGDLYVSRANDPPAPNSSTGSGSIVRLSSTGARIATYVSDAFRGPSSLAIGSDGSVYAANWGVMNAGYGGRISRTEPATGLSSAPVLTSGCSAVAVSLDQRVYYSYQETTQSGTRYRVVDLAGSWVADDVTGNFVVVPEEPVAARSATWGSVKRAYR